MSDDTSDLLEQLRTRHVKLGFNEVTESLFSAAADEIERLRKDIYKQHLDIVTLKQEVRRLREALKLADGALSGANMNMRVVERKVRAALAEQEKK